MTTWLNSTSVVCNSDNNKPTTRPSDSGPQPIINGTVLYNMTNAKVYMYDADKAAASQDPWVAQN